MEHYLTIREAAEKWGVSERRINQYCSEGRIPGAERIGKVWAIPVDAEKPGDPRKTKKESEPDTPSNAPAKAQELFPGFMPLMNTAFVPGCCMETIEKMKAGPKKDIALAEYHYFSGQAEKAMQETEIYLTAPDGAVRLSACLIFAYSCLTMGRIDHARRALHEIQKTLADSGKNAPPVRTMEAFVAFAAAVLLHLPLPEEMPPMETFLPLLPPGRHCGGKGGGGGYDPSRGGRPPEGAGRRIHIGLPLIGAGGHCHHRRQYGRQKRLHEEPHPQPPAGADRLFRLRKGLFGAAVRQRLPHLHGPPVRGAGPELLRSRGGGAGRRAAAGKGQIFLRGAGRVCPGHQSAGGRGPGQSVGGISGPAQLRGASDDPL